MLATDVALLSERGGRSYNEDACGHWLSGRYLCCVVADGAGGHSGGDVASRLAVQELLHEFCDTPTHDGTQLLGLVRRTNEVLLSQRKPGASADMHTTIVCLVVDLVEHQAHWAHAGDSRLYWFRHDRIVARTADHSLVQALVDAHMIAPDEMRHHPKRSELRSALGTATSDLEITASARTADLAAGDVFLLCTDGVWEHLDDSVLETLLANASTPAEWLANLEAQVEEVTHDRTSHDNFSALAVWLSSASETDWPQS